MASSPRNRARTSLLLGLLVLSGLSTLNLTPAAHAYTWARTVATDRPLHWSPDAQVDWRADSASLATQARAALTPWRALRCDSELLPYTTQEQPPEVMSPNLRWIHQTQDWTLGSDVFAYTAVVHQAGTGVISRFDMRLNGATQQFCDDTQPCAGAEAHLPTVLAHEWGHVWGLDHSDATTALMFGLRHPGEIIPGPTADDRAGLCALYGAVAPPAAAPATADGWGCSAGRTFVSPPLGARFFTLFALMVGLLCLVRTTSSRHQRRRQTLNVSRRSSSRRYGVGPLRLSMLTFLWLLFSWVPAHGFILAQSKSGAHQRWYANEITYTIEAKGLLLQGISDAAVQASAARGFATWSSVQCGLCHDPNGVSCAPVACDSHPLGLNFRFSGSTTEQPALACEDGSLPGADNPDCVLVANGSQIAFIDTDWPHGSTVIATTIVAADEVSGRIADADIQFNTQDKRFCLDGRDCPLGEYDLDNTMTHEIGHLLGLDHSLDGDATMYGGAPPGEVRKRDLLADDIAGVCTAYRQAWTSAGCPAEETGCCSAAPTKSPTRGWPWLVTLIGAAMTLVLRRVLAGRVLC